MPTLHLGLVISNSTCINTVWLQRDDWYRKYSIDKHSLWLWQWTKQPDLSTTSSGLWQCIIKIQIKIGYKKLTNLVDIIQKQKQKQNKQTYMHQLYEPLLWPWPWNSKTIFLHNAQIHGDVSPYQVWLQKIQKIVWTNINWTLPELSLWLWQSSTRYSSWYCIRLSLVAKD